MKKHLIAILLLVIFPLSAKNPFRIQEEPADITNNNITININQQQSTESHTNLCAEQITTEEPAQKKTSSHTTARIATTIIVSSGVLTACARELVYLVAGFILEPTFILLHT